MKEHAQSTTDKSHETVRRATEVADKGFSAETQAQLERVIEEQWLSQGEEAARIAELTRRAYEPVQRIVEADADAKAAVQDLYAQRTAAFERRLLSRGARRTLGGGLPVDLFPAVGPGVNVFAKPYDFEIQRQQGASVSTHANRLDGTFSFALAWGQGGARFATAGVGLTLEATATGFAHVRPVWSYDYGAMAHGHWLSSETQGTARVVVQDAFTSNVLKEGSAPLWNFWNDHDEFQNGFIDSWALALDFPVKAGQMFSVSFFADGMVDDSGTQIGWSLAGANIDMAVPFLVVELGP